jgi:integrase/recombinase XerD
MAGRVGFVSNLACHVDDYLRLRRALGFKLEWPGHLRPQLLAYHAAAGASTLTTDLTIAWAQLPQGVQPLHWAHRLGAARGFATYLKTIDPTTEVPPPPRDVFGAHQRRPPPYLWSDTDVCRLLKASRGLQPPLRAATHEALFGLLAVSGMRRGEAIDLGRDDVDLADGVLTIREAKFGRSRMVPLHPSAVEALRSYAALRDHLCPKPRSTTFFVSSIGTALHRDGVHKTFVELTTAIALRTHASRPRIHDLRHSFAVHTLIESQRSSADCESQMASLSTYLGHVNPVGTYWYLSAAPELMELAATRLDGRFGGRL